MSSLHLASPRHRSGVHLGSKNSRLYYTPQIATNPLLTTTASTLGIYPSPASTRNYRILRISQFASSERQYCRSQSGIGEPVRTAHSCAVSSFQPPHGSLAHARRHRPSMLSRHKAPTFSTIQLAPCRTWLLRHLDRHPQLAHSLQNAAGHLTLDASLATTTAPRRPCGDAQPASSASHDRRQPAPRWLDAPTA